jgi:DNA-binding transcriptional LysR family regulator
VPTIPEKNVTKFDLNSIALLVEIIDAGSLSSAALRNKLSRSAVSHRLKTLENALGVQLLRRTTRRLEPTEIGQRLYEHGRIIVGELAQLRAKASTAGNSPSGAVRLSLPTGLGDALISSVLMDFKRAFPLVRLEVIFENRVLDLLADEVDVAIRILSSPPESLHVLDLGNVDWVMCAAPDYLERVGIPTRLDQLPSLEIICAAAVGRKLGVSATRCAQRTTITVNPGLHSENFQFLKHAVIAGLGFGILPFYQVESDLSAGRLVGLMPEYRFSVFGRKVMLLAMPDRYRTAASGALIEFLKVRVRADMAAFGERFDAARLAPRSAAVTGRSPPADTQLFAGSAL